jgi:outer membrane protein TolC
LLPLLLLASATLAQAETVTLEQAASEALQRNPRIAAAEAGRRAAEARHRQNLASWIPSAGVTASVTRGDNPVFVFGSLLEQGRFGAEHFDPAFLNDPDPLTNSRVALDLRYTFFDGFRRIAATRQSQEGLRQADGEVEEQRQRLLADVIAAWFGVVVADESRAVAAKAVESARAEAEAVRDRLAQGLVVESDLLAAEVQEASYRQQEIDAEAEAAIARATLASILQRPVTGLIDVSREMPAAGPPAPRALEETLQAGLARRGAVAAAQAARTAAAQGLRASRGALYPRIDAQASWGASGQTFAEGNSDHTYAAMASFEILNPARWAGIAESRATLEAASSAEASARSGVTLEIVSAHHRLRSASLRVEVARRAARQAAAAAGIVQDRYTNGLTTITEWLRADTARVAAELDLLRARFDEITGYAELLRATGELHDVQPFH